MSLVGGEARFGMTYSEVIIRLIRHADNDLVFVTKRCDQLCNISASSTPENLVSARIP